MDNFRGRVVDIMNEQKHDTITLYYEHQKSVVPVTITTLLLITIAQDNRLKVAKTLTGFNCTRVQLPKKITLPTVADKEYREALLNVAIHMGYTGDYFISPFTKLKITDSNVNNLGNVLMEQIPAFKQLCDMLDINPECVDFDTETEQVDRIIQECFSYTVLSRLPEKLRKNYYYDPDVQEESGSDKEIIPKFKV